MIFTVPTCLTFARLLVLPLLLWLLLRGDVWAAFALYCLGAFTDFLDGYLARTLDQVSDFGTFLDPIADKVYVCAVFVSLVAAGHVDGFGLASIVVILSREFLVSGLREFLGPRGGQLPVTSLAKWKTTFQMIATGVLIVGQAVLFAPLVGHVLLHLAAVLTVVTGYIYVRGAWPVISGVKG